MKVSCLVQERNTMPWQGSNLDRSVPRPAPNHEATVPPFQQWIESELIKYSHKATSSAVIYYS